MGLPFIKEALTQLFSKPSTANYPFVPREAPPNYRGRIVFHPELCINCNMCERVCSGGAISHSGVETEEGELITRRFFLGACTFCAHCSDFCAKNAIELSGDYHMVAREESDLDVEGTYLKKKPAPKPIPPKPAEQAKPEPVAEAKPEPKAEEAADPACAVEE